MQVPLKQDAQPLDERAGPARPANCHPIENKITFLKPRYNSHFSIANTNYTKYKYSGLIAIRQWHLYHFSEISFNNIYK